jgi:Ca-activated chloride channel family protein
MKKPAPSETGSSLGLIAYLEATRIRLPLKAVDCRFNVFGDIADVRIDQVFEQNNATALDVTYTFPLPAEAAVYGCEMTVNGRVIRAVVKEENEARELAAKFKAEGRRVARTEAPRENLFNLELGNVQPGDAIVIRLEYFQILDRIGDSVSLAIPSCPGIRYIPGKPLLRSNRGKGAADDTDQVPDASKITPPRIGDLHPDAAYFSLEGSLSAEGADETSVSSPSHGVIVSKKGERLAIRLAARGDSVPDRDFILRWRENAGATALRALTHRSGAHTYAVVRVAAPRGLPEAAEEPKDVYLLLDRSSSMQGIKWAKAAEALGRFARELAPHDRVFLTLFDNAFIDFDEHPISPADLLADPSFESIGEMEGPRGGTELLPALRHVLGKAAQHSSVRPASIVLITDGEVGNEAEICRALSGSGVTVHCFGIDTTVNDAFLKRMARESGGACLLLSPHDNIPSAVAAMAVRMRRPALLDLMPSDEWEPARGVARAVADIHAGEAVTLVFRGPADAGELRLFGKRVDGAPVEFRFPIEPDSSEAPRLMWAKGRIEQLLAYDRQTEAVALATEHNLVCEGTSFLAWDDAERVPVAQRGLYQPSMMPGEWDLAAAPGSRLPRDPRNRHGVPAALYCAIGDDDSTSFGELLPDTSAPLLERLGFRRHAKAPQHPAPSPMEELVRRYHRFADAGLPFPIGSDPTAVTIRGKRRIERLREALLRAFDPLGENVCKIVVGILMTWLVRGGRAELHDRTVRLESMAGTPRTGDPRETLAEIAAGLTGEEADALRRLLAELQSPPAGKKPRRR